MKSLLDPSFRYVNAASTNLRKTFARVRREREQAAKQQPRPEHQVLPMKQPKK